MNEGISGSSTSLVSDVHQAIQPPRLAGIRVARRFTTLPYMSIRTV